MVFLTIGNDLKVDVINVLSKRKGKQRIHSLLTHTHTHWTLFSLYIYVYMISISYSCCVVVHFMFHQLH